MGNPISANNFVTPGPSNIDELEVILASYKEQSPEKYAAREAEFNKLRDSFKKVEEAPAEEPKPEAVPEAKPEKAKKVKP